MRCKARELLPGRLCDTRSQDQAARIRPSQATSAGLEDKEDRMCPSEHVPVND